MPPAHDGSPALAPDDVPEVAGNAWARLRDELEAILGDNLVAIWAHGGTIMPRSPPRAADLDTYVILNRRPDEATRFGRGVVAQLDPLTDTRAFLAIRGSVIAGSHDVGVSVEGADATLESTTVRDTLRAADLRTGRGINAQTDAPTSTESTLAVAGALVEASTDVGVYVDAEVADLRGLLVRDTAAGGDSQYGDGVFVEGRGAATAATLVDTLVHNSARAGIATFDANVVVGTTTLWCNAIDLDGEGGYELVDLGGTACGCGAEMENCQVATSQLEPPPPLEP